MDYLPIKRACDVLGGQAEMARLLVVSPAYINQMCQGLRGVPAERCPAIERATRAAGDPVLCEELRPDISWDVLRGPEKAQQVEAQK